MDFQKSKALLDKINALYKNISGDPRNVSSIERDLMRSYVRQFYEAFLEMPTVAEAVTPPPAPVEPKPAEPKITLRRPETAPPPLRPQPEPPKPEPPKVVEPTPAPVVVPPPPPPPPVVVEKPVEVAPPPPPPPPVREEPAPPPPVYKALVTQHDPDLEALFAVKNATELSEKLSQLPIGDIKKAMGLNERISTQAELFGGDAAIFDSTVNALNQLKSYEEAKNYLIETVALKYKWASSERKDKAKEFIKLVKRRY